MNSNAAYTVELILNEKNAVGASEKREINFELR